MELTFRAACLEDFDAFYACCYSTFGYSDAFRADVEAEWRTFRQNPGALTVVVEDLNRDAKERVVGYAEAVFVADKFAEAAKTGNRPFLNKQIAEAARHGRSLLLDTAQVRKAQSGAGITLFIAYIGWSEERLTPEEACKVREYTNRAMNHLGLGYHYREVMIEVAGETPRKRGLDAGFYLRTDYSPFYGDLDKPGSPEAGIALPSPELRPYLLSITRAEAFQRDGSLLSHSFVYSKPRFAFREREQELLCWALQGRSDEEIAPFVHVSEEAIKKRWDRIYGRVDEVLPTLFPTRSDSRRGPGKRGLLLAYLRDHPEELRPCVVPLRGFGLPMEGKP
jgi:DNA-binding CsgD family transcriptional regulator